MPEKICSYAKFDVDALLSLATEIRGQACTCDVTTAPKTGSMNWVMFLSFKDGLDWVFRSPRTGAHAIMSDESSQKMLLSEVATLNSLRRKTAVPVPEVCSFSETWQNPIGVPYILMSKAAGRPLSDYDWADVRTLGYPKLLPLLPMSHCVREGIMMQLCAMMRELEKNSFEKIGSLFEDSDGTCVIGECLSPALVWQHRDSLEDYGIERDPLLHEDQYFNALISAFIGHATELPLTNHAFFAPLPDHSDYADWASYRAAVGRWNDYVAMGSKIETGQNRFAYCLGGQVLRDMMPHFSEGRKAIRYLIQTFTSAIYLWMTASILHASSTGALRQPAQSRNSWLHLSNNPPEHILFKALNFNSLARHESNQELLASLQADDATADEIEQEELAAFGNLAGKDDSRAVARKLTFMAEVNPNFVTSPKLWKWIESALKTE